MNPSSFERIQSDLKNKVYSPVYFLTGEEPFYIDEIIRQIETEVLDEANREFNQTVVYGRDVTAKEVVDLCRRFPMMSNYQVVIVKEAQDLTANNRKLDDLELYLEHPMETTILVLGFKYKKLDKRKTLWKKLTKSPHVTLLETKKIYENKIPQWIEQRVQSFGYTIDPVSAVLLADHVGNDLARLSNEINKLVITIPQGGKITPDLIEEKIGISKEFNVFEFTKALGSGDVYKAQRIIKYFESNPKDNPLQMITVILYNFFVKVFLYHIVKKSGRQKDIASALGVPNYFIKDYQVAANHYSARQVRKVIADIRELDLKSKGFGASDGKSYGPLKEFVFKTIHKM